ncbi:MAG: hypothetical protein OXU40_06815, partial [Nitrospira sp.]|nr:hypothetical protein [Nitrospira sp.]
GPGSGQEHARWSSPPLRHSCVRRNPGAGERAGTCPLVKPPPPSFLRTQESKGRGAGRNMPAGQAPPSVIPAYAGIQGPGSGQEHARWCLQGRAMVSSSAPIGPAPNTIVADTFVPDATMTPNTVTLIPNVAKDARRPIRPPRC